MDSTSMDHYEKQLYSVFKTFDVDNQEALDKSAVLDLCNVLQLDDKSSTLVGTLFEKPADKVTFTQFRNGLLSVLGGGDPPTRVPGTFPSHSDDDSSGREVAPKFVYGSKKYGRRSKPHSVGCASNRDEVGVSSPDSPRSGMASVDLEVKNRKASLKAKKMLPVESSSETSFLTDTDSVQCDLEHDRFIDYEESMTLCKTLNMDNVDKQIVKQIFNESSSSNSNKITIGEFFHRLNNSLTMSIASTCHNDSILSNDNTLNESLEVGTYNGMVETKKLLEAWEQAGVQSEHGQTLLHGLGFTASTLHVTELSNALDEELRVLSVEPISAPNDARTLLLQASLALHRFQFIRIKHIMEQIFIENNKLRNDLSDANRRSQVLAQEVDENHARMEVSLKNKIKQLDVKHAENLKMLTNEWNNEKEKTAGVIAALEETKSRLVAEETRLRTENTSMLHENEDLRKRINANEERIAELDTIRLQLSKDIKVLAMEKVESKKAGDEQNMVKDLASRIDDLQLENKMLRDRNDELCAEVDSLTSNVSRDDQRHPVKSSPLSVDIIAGKIACWHDETDGLESGDRPGKRRGDSPSLSLARLSDDESPRVGKVRKKLSSGGDVADNSGVGLTDVDSNSEGPTSLTTLYVTHHSQECDSSLVSLDQKFVGHLEIIRKLQEIIDSSHKISMPDMCESCNTMKGIIAMIQDKIKDMTNCIIYTDHSMKMETSTASVQTEIDNNEVESLKESLSSTEKQHQEEKMRLENLVKDLENSLEQMKLEYDKCEEYWSSKLDDERDAYNEEQKISDERLTELISKISEYEEQFAPKTNNSTLPTIDEKYSLEVQFTDLEEEFDKYKEEKERELKAKVEELKKLKQKLKSMEQTNLSNGVHSPNVAMSEKNDGGSTVSSPIGYLWSQGTIQTPFIKGNKKMSVRDYHNPAFVQSSQSSKCDENRCSSDSEKDKGNVNPIQRPGLTQRSSSVGALRDDRGDRDKPMGMIHCADLEGQLRKQHVQNTVPTSFSSSTCGTCAALEHRCRQLHAALRHHQMCLDTVQQAARSEGATLRSRIAATEAAVVRLQQRLAAADLLVKDLYLENCQLAHHSQRRLL